MSLFQKAITLLTGSPKDMDTRPLKSLTERELIELESDIGRYLFGPVPRGHRREFFCLDDHTWIWYEQWKNEQGKDQERTTRYEVHPNGILKSYDGGNYGYLDADEMQNFGVAVRLYYEQVMRGIYKRDPATGELLTTLPSSAPNVTMSI
ncbi:MAG: hypothetical protein WAT17_02025 [Candidatus Saccharimonadales bacterium]|jgi:hypothetical protein